MVQLQEWRLRACALASLIGASVWSINASAQSTQAPESPAAAAETRAPEVTVTATRTSRAVSDVPVTLDVITAPQMEAQQAHTPADLVRYQPGVSAPNEPDRFGGTGFNIRGLTDNRVLVQTDGIRQPDFFRFSIGPFNTNPPNFVDVDSLERLEIMRGPASSLYGSDALGGVVAYTTKDPSDYLGGRERPWYASWRTAYATRDESWTNTLTAALGSEILQGLAVLTLRNAGEQETQGVNDSVGPNRTVANPQDIGVRNALLKLVATPGDGHLLRLTYEQFKRSVDTDVLSLNYATPRTSSLIGDDEFKRQRASFDYEYANPAGGWFAGLRVKVYWQTSESDEASAERRAQTTAGCSGVTVGVNTCAIQRLFQFEQTTIGGSVQGESRLSGGYATHRLIYGIDVANTDTAVLRDATVFNLTTGTTSKTLAGDRFPVRDFPDGAQLRIGVFAQDEIGLLDERLQVIPGIRYDYYRLDAKPDSVYTANAPTGARASDLTDSAISPKIGALWHLNTQTAVYANLATGFRAPPYDDVNAAFRNPIQSYAIIPNPDLKSEKSVGTEIGVRGNHPQLNFSAAAFYNRYRDFIDSQVRLACPSDPRCVSGFGITFQSINRTNVVIFGAEAAAQYSITPQWVVHGSVAFSRGEDTDEDIPINSINPIQGVIGLRYDDSGGRYGASAIVTAASPKRRVDDSQVTPPPQFRTPGFAIVDLTAYWRPIRHLTVSAGVFNLFDQKYWIWTDVFRTGIGPNTTSPPAASIDRYTQPGRNLAVSLKLDF